MTKKVINKNNGLVRIETINKAEQTIGFDGSIIYVSENKTIYEFQTNSVEVADNEGILNTGASGTTRWIGTAGMYSVYGSASSSGIIDVTYLELQTIVTASGLSLNKFYRITDFITTFKQERTDILMTGDFEPLIVQPASETTFRPQVYSPSFPNDTIIYDFFDDTVEVLGNPRTGKITYRKDNDKNLSAYFDWRSIRHRRYRISSVTGAGSLFTNITIDTNSWVSMSYSINTVTFNVDSGTYRDYYTFAIQNDSNISDGGNMRDISIGGEDSDENNNGRYYNNVCIIANSVSASSSISNINIDSNCWGITIKGAAKNVKIAPSCQYIVLFQNATDVNIGGNSQQIVGRIWSGLNIGGYCQLFTCAYFLYSNTAPNFTNMNCGNIYNTNFEAGITGLNLQSATRVSSSTYNKTVTLNESGAPVLRYIDFDNIQRIVAAID